MKPHETCGEIASHRPDPAAVQEHLVRVLASAQFSGSTRLSRFLRYCVQSALGDPAGRLKEFDIALSVFDRESDFDPRLDPIVRVQAVRLRGKLKEYYHEDGNQEQLRILLPKGGYTASFEYKSERPAASARESLAPPSAPDATAVASTPEPIRRPESITLRNAMAAFLAPVLSIRKTKLALVMHRSVAVMDFRNLSGSEEPNWLPRAIREMLAGELGRAPRIQALPEASVARIRAEIAPAGIGGFDKSTLEQIQKSTGADLVLSGSYLAIGGKIRLDVHLQETHSGKTLELQSRMDDESNLLDLIATVGARIRATLGARHAAPYGQAFRETAAAIDSND